MDYTGLNLTNMKRTNRSRILRLLNDKGEMSRKDIAGELSLTPAAVTQICGELLNQGILKEKGQVTGEKRAGRKKILIGIDYDFAYVLGIVIELDLTTVSVSSLRGKCLKKKTLVTDPSADPFTFLMKCVNLARRLLEDLHLKKDQFLGCGVSIPGLVLRDRGISVNTYRIWNQEIPIREKLSKMLNMPVIVENNVKACAEAELTYGAGRENKNLFFLKWGPGVGSALAVHNEIYDNHEGRTSELGHVVIQPHGGERCRCGKYGCLETVVSTHAIVRALREGFSWESMPKLWEFAKGDPENITVDNRSQWSSLDDPGMNRTFDRLLGLLCQTLANAATVIAPDQVIYYGDIFTIPYFKDHFEEAYYREDPWHKEGFLIHSTLSDKIDYIGPLAILYNEKLLNQR
jgi:transcriptional regulator of PTS gene